MKAFTEDGATKTVKRQSPAATMRVRKARLRVTRGPNTGASMLIEAPIIRVGTAPDCDLVLTDDTISRRHCEIRNTSDVFWIRDLDSTNGVLINGVRVHEAVLAPLSSARLGQSEISLVPLEEMLEIALWESDSFGGLIGPSSVMRALFASLNRIAGANVTVLIEGETGTGKDLVAETLHNASPRASGPFVPVDCGALPPTMIESELFGHKKGAFTGAASDRPGLIEAADGGTLFLDEMGELPKEIQPKLLRVLEKRETRRVGENTTRRVDVRVIAATNRKLLAEVQAGNFREDLFYRLAVARVTVPALRERRDDILPLAAHFIREAGGRGLEDLPPNADSMLLNHTWPGNVRELRNVVQRLLVDPGARVTEHTPTPSAGDPFGLDLKKARKGVLLTFERDYIKEVLRRCGGNVVKAATHAGVSRQLFYRLIARHGLR